MESRLSNVVVSQRGRDKGQILLVVGEEENILLVANGRMRRAESPKRKKASHVVTLGKAESAVLEHLRAGDRLTNSDVRKALAPWGESADKT